MSFIVIIFQSIFNKRLINFISPSLTTMVIHHHQHQQVNNNYHLPHQHHHHHRQNRIVQRHVNKVQAHQRIMTIGRLR